MTATTRRKPKNPLCKCFKCRRWLRKGDTTQWLFDQDSDGFTSGNFCVNCSPADDYPDAHLDSYQFANTLKPKENAMATQPMTKFVVNDPKSTEPACLYLKAPTDEQLDAVIAWLHAKQIDMVTCIEGEAVFTKTGKGKPSPAIAIQFQSRIDFDAVAAKMAKLYPCPKDLSGIKLTTHEVTDELADHKDAVAADAVQHAEAAIAATVADAAQPEPTPLGTGTAVSADDETRCYSVEELQAAKNDRTAQLEHDLIAIGATGPLPSATPINPDDVPF